MKTWLQIGLITLLCGGLYAGLRSIPYTECTFLHYQSPEVREDGLEFCGEANPMYLDFTRLRYPIRIEIESESPLVAGQPNTLRLKLVSDRGKTILPHDIAVSHTELVHMLMADPSLTDYHHLHPKADGPGGGWQIPFTPEKSGSYRVFAEFVLNRTRQKIVTLTHIEVDGPPNPGPRWEFARGEQSQSLDGLEFTLSTQPQTLTRNRETLLNLTVRDSAGNPVELQPIMGALAHLVAFDEDRKGYAHLHPRFTGRETEPNPELEFSFQSAKPGPYRVWAQMKIDGRERYVPFDLEVR